MAKKWPIAGFVSKLAEKFTGFTEKAAAGKPPADDVHGLTLGLGGEANALGENTHAVGKVSSKVIDTERVTIAKGSATFSATADSKDGTAYAAADTYADVASADLVFMRTRETTRAGETDGKSYMTETSQTRVFAIDIEGIDLPRGPIVLSGSASHGGSGRPQHVQGNVAAVTVQAEAHGNNTSVAVDATALTVEDQYSGVTATVVTEVA
jgi:hypothetical protein